MRTTILAIALLAAALPLGAADSIDYRAEERTVEQGFSCLDALPFPESGFLSRADRPETPGLAGGRRAAAARRLEPAAARRFEPFEENRWDSESIVAGGIIDEAAFGGARVSAGGLFGAGDVLAFSRFDLGIEYDKFLGTPESGKSLGFGLAGGFAGNLPIPWALGARAVLKGADGEKYATLAAEAGDAIAEIEGLGTLSAFASIGADLGEAGAQVPGKGIFARAWAELEGREWRGALARGMAAWTACEARLDPEDPGADAELSAGIEASSRLGSFAGLSGRLSFLAATEARDDWTLLLRGLPRERGKVEGGLGAALGLEAMILFARGTLFMKPDMGVEFFAKPYLDVALVRPSKGDASFASSLYAVCGAELAMTIDSDRRQCLRARAGLDLSGAARGEGMPSSADLAIEAVFSFAL